MAAGGVLRCGRRMMSSSGGGGSGVSPWLMLQPEYGLERTLSRFFNLEEKKVMRSGEIERIDPYKMTKLVGSSHGWVAWFTKRDRSLYLSNPVRGRVRFELPSLPVDEDDADRDDYWRNARTCVSHVTISCSPFHQDCLAFMLYGASNQRLALCVPPRRGGCDKWSLIADGGSRFKYESLAYSNRRKALFCITQQQQVKYELESWDLVDPDSPRRIDSLPLNFDDDSNLKKRKYLQYKYLVVLDEPEQLFLVVRHVVPPLSPDRPQHGASDCNHRHLTVDFDVYKIELERRSVSLMDSSLDGLAFFVGGVNQPFAVRPMPPTSHLNPNSIYFADLPDLMQSRRYNIEHDNGDDGVFNYETRAFSSLYHSFPIELRHLCIKHMLTERLPLWYSPMSG